MKRKSDTAEKPSSHFYHATHRELLHQATHGDVDSSTASDAVRAAKRRRGPRAAQVLNIQNTALAIRVTAAQRLAAWRDLTKSYESLEEDDKEIFATQYAVLAAAARRSMDPEKAITLYATLKAKIEKRKKLRKEGAEKKRKKGVKTRYTRTKITGDGGTTTHVCTIVKTADEHVAWEARRDALAKMDPKERPMAASQMCAPGQNPLSDQGTGQRVWRESPKSSVAGTYENGVFQCNDRTFAVCKVGWTGPKTDMVYFATRAEADAQRAEWIRKKWLPKPPPPPNAVSKSTSEAPHSH